MSGLQSLGFSHLPPNEIVFSSPGARVTSGETKASGASPPAIRASARRVAGAAERFRSVSSKVMVFRVTEVTIPGYSAVTGGLMRSAVSPLIPRQFQ